MQLGLLHINKLHRPAKQKNCGACFRQKTKMENELIYMEYIPDIYTKKISMTAANVIKLYMIGGYV